MTTNQILATVFEVCIIPLLSLLTGYLIKWIRSKAEHVKAQTSNELYQKYIDMLANTISNCVLATQQTYVDSLKKAGSFGPEEQKIAFQNTLAAVRAQLSSEAYDYLNEIMGDLDGFISQQIESKVYSLKG